nr:hypothetical protein [Lelliottia steviae]
MPAIIEEKLMKCSRCSKTTKHHRNSSKSSGFMLLIHLILTIATAGIWLLLVIVWKIINKPIGGWKCSICE